MTGTGYILAGIILMVSGTAALAALEFWLVRKKRKIREKTYQIYD